MYIHPRDLPEPQVTWRELLRILSRATGIGYRCQPSLDKEPEHFAHLRQIEEIKSKLMETKVELRRELNHLKRSS